MAWDERSYFREEGRPDGGFWWLLSGSVPLFRVSGIRVRAHASLVLFIGVALLVMWGGGYTLENKVAGISALLAVLLLHEFSHCLIARAVGGHAHEIVLWPFGGLSVPATVGVGPSSVVALAGPAMNLTLCILSASAIYLSQNDWLLLNPAHIFARLEHGVVQGPILWAMWLYVVSFVLLVINLLPILPLDGGRMVEAILSTSLGAARSAYVTCIVGMIGSGVLVLIGTLRGLDWFTILLGASLFIYCRMRFGALKIAEPQEELAGGGLFETSDFGASLQLQQETEAPRPVRRRSRAQIRRLRKQALRESALRQRIDTILAKVSAQGIHSLTWLERRALRQATERERRREVEFSQ